MPEGFIEEKTMNNIITILDSDPSYCPFHALEAFGIIGDDGKIDVKDLNAYSNQLPHLTIVNMSPEQQRQLWVNSRTNNCLELTQTDEPNIFFATITTLESP